jgi:glycosyltransferase involved in cell wall biosynthesis
MKLSIITVCYNSAATIRDAVDSVLAQQGVGIEYIVIDGDSSDGTVEILKGYGERITHLVSEPDKGIYDAMNKGVALATGDVVGILNSDDFYADASVLAAVVAAFEGNMNVERRTSNVELGTRNQEHRTSNIERRTSNIEQQATNNEHPATPPACVYGDLDYVDAEDTNRVVRAWRSKPYAPGAFRRGWHPAHPSFFVRRSVYERLGSFNLDLKIAADYEFMLRVLEREQLKSVYVPKVLVKMRLGGASNASIKNIVKANLQCWKAWRINGLGWSPLPIVAKPLSKLKQFAAKRE